MQFTNINILSIIIFVVLIGVIAFLAYKKFLWQQNFNKEFILLKSDDKFYLKYIFLILSIFIILFGIFWVKFWDKKISMQSKWIDTMFVLDVSKSMNVADINDWNYSYKRLDLAKKAIADFVSKHPEDRFWLVIFAWDAISTIPLTLDHNLFLTMLSGVDYRNLTVQGSDFKKALELAISRFTWDDDRSKALIFISDWWDPWDKVDFNLNIPSWITSAVVWVGTEKWWRIIKGTDVFWRPIFQKYKWQYVISKLNMNNLEKIADLLNAEIVKLNKVSDLEKLDKYFSKLEKKVLKKSASWELADFGRNLAIFSFILFIIFLVLYLKPKKD